jgi:hypothetical protein
MNRTVSIRSLELLILEPDTGPPLPAVIRNLKLFQQLFGFSALERRHCIVFHTLCNVFEVLSKFRSQRE